MIIEKPVIQIVKEEKPRELNYKNVVYWSEHFKRLEGIKQGQAIQTKAKLFLKKGCIKYDPNESGYDSYSSNFDGHRFICSPIPGYNKHTYRLWWNKELNDFECSCQFNQTIKIPCSHITALWLQIRIWNWNRKNKQNA